MHRPTLACLKACARRWITRIARVDFLSCFRAARVYFVLVVGHESGRRNWKTAPVTETGFSTRKTLRSNEVRAGRKPAASDRGVIPWRTRKRRRGHPKLMGSKGPVRQVGLESPHVTQQRECIANDRSSSLLRQRRRQVRSEALSPPRGERVPRPAVRRTQRARAALEER